MPTNGFLPNSTGVGAKVLSDVDYAASDALAQGAQVGELPPEYYNKVNRQATVISSMIGQFIVDRAGVDANDSQSIATLEANFIAALRSVVGSGVTLVTAQTLYVRPDGNDANDGSANDAAHAFQTITAAITASYKYLTTGAPVVIKLGIPGIYAAPGPINLSGRSVKILGDIANQGAYIIQGAGSYANALISCNNGSMAVSGITVNNTGTVADSIGPGLGGIMVVDRVTFQCATGNPASDLACYGGFLNIGPGCVFSSSRGTWLNTIGGTVSFFPSANLTWVNNPTYSIAGINCTNLCVVTFSNGFAPVISGTAVGPRYSVSYNSVIQTYGAGGLLFPGSTAGSTSFGGIYS